MVDLRGAVAKDVGYREVRDGRIGGDRDDSKDQEHGQDDDGIHQQPAQHQCRADEIIEHPGRGQKVRIVAEMLRLRRFLLVEPAVERKRIIRLHHARDQGGSDIAAARHRGEIIDGIEDVGLVMVGQRIERLQHAKTKRCRAYAAARQRNAGQVVVAGQPAGSAHLGFDIVILLNELLPIRHVMPRRLRTIVGLPGFCRAGARYAPFLDGLATEIDDVEFGVEYLRE